METIGEQKLWSFVTYAANVKPTKCTKIRSGQAHPVASFMELATKVAELQFMNRDFVLLYRGQWEDHRNTHGNTSLKPSLFRPVAGRNPNGTTVMQRFERLREAERLLVDRYRDDRFTGIDRLKRQQILRWSILQHYEVCAT